MFVYWLMVIIKLNYLNVTASCLYLCLDVVYIICTYLLEYNSSYIQTSYTHGLCFHAIVLIINTHGFLFYLRSSESRININYLKIKIEVKI